MLSFTMVSNFWGYHWVNLEERFYKNKSCLMRGLRKVKVKQLSITTIRTRAELAKGPMVTLLIEKQDVAV